MTFFAGAYDFKPPTNFISSPDVDAGQKEILSHSMPDAFHDSAARYPPPRCYPGTSKEYISRIIRWALGEMDHEKPVLWMRGPLGTGKTAVAQSSAEKLKNIQKLLATLFLSHSSANRDDPLRVFASIAYQIASLHQPFADLISALVRKDPSITQKSLLTQFEELIVAPLRSIRERGFGDIGLEGQVVIIDGLDECRGTVEQCEIIRIIAASARDRTTPFRWLITSRPEDPIIRTINSPIISSVVSRVELPVSREIGPEIFLFLTNEFMEIRNSHGLPEAWPGKAFIDLLAARGAGLWKYVSTIVRFIRDEDSLGPEEQLRVVLKFINNASNKVGPTNPLAELDFSYTRVMQRIPSNIWMTVWKFLLLRSLDSSVNTIVQCLSLSIDQFRRYCTFLQSVMELREHRLHSFELHFYHASFVDFLTDPGRSREFCIRGEPLIQYRRELLEWLHYVCSQSTEPSHFVFPVNTTLPEEIEGGKHYESVLGVFWELCSIPDHPIDISTATSISNLPFQKMLILVPKGSHCLVDQSALNKNLPVEFRDKIIRRGECPTPGCTKTHPVYIFGHGDNEAFAHMDPFEHIVTGNDQNNSAKGLGRGSEIQDGGSRELSRDERGRGIRNSRWRGQSEQTKLREFAEREEEEEEEEESVHEERVQLQVAHNENEEVQMFRDDLDTKAVEGLPSPLEDASHERTSSVECFRGTRTQYIEDFVAWSTGSDHWQDRLYWLRGPARAGKSAVARSCAYEIAKEGTLGASFFFSCENDIVDSTHFFITIAHQLASRIPQFKITLRRKLRADPTISTGHSLERQFQELIIQPFLAVGKQDPLVEPKTIVVDGLDHCADTVAQSTILRLVVESIKTYNTQVPLLWAFFSRPEAHIASVFSEGSISRICKQVQLKVSHDLDDEIRVYLRGTLEVSDDPFASWALSESDLDLLVRMAAGFYFYAAEMHPLELHLSPLASLLALEVTPLTRDERGSAIVVPVHASFIDFLMNESRSKEFWINRERNWCAIALRGFALLDGIIKIKDMPYNARLGELRKLFPGNFQLNTLSHYLYYQEELYDYLRQNVVRWCVRSGSSDNPSEALRMLHHSGFRILQRAGIEVNPDLLSLLSEETRSVMSIIRPLWHHPTLEQEQTLQTVLDPAANEAELRKYCVSVFEIALSSVCDQSYFATFRRSIDDALGAGHSVLLHSQVRDYFSSHLHQLLTELWGDRIGAVDATNIDLLEAYVDQWKKYEAVISSLFWNHKTLANDAIFIWKRDFYMPLQSEEYRLTCATLDLIEQYRQGKLLGDHPRSFIESLLRMKDSFNPTPLLDSDVYYTHFEVKYLESTKEFYGVDPTLHSDNALYSRLERVKSDLIQERTLLIALDLPLPERQRCMQECSRILLDSSLDTIYTEFKRLLDFEVGLDIVKRLRHICLVTYWLPDVTQQLEFIFKAHVKESALASVSVIEVLDEIIRDHPEWDNSTHVSVAPSV
ncbi:hypothetical protein NP233_g4634 [Leucocoprinus birnbaumii]|uniref:NACHT domain-containing protein n=1 Tax=Leucocoprinus birnbaumii TaxID=56174 RepID=A0AAD5VUX4_9AGAR|nr:hypothetical protein NP233_g4634 [Leucocoprinus birnbaumii]